MGGMENPWGLGEQEQDNHQGSQWRRQALPGCLAGVQGLPPAKMPKYYWILLGFWEAVIDSSLLAGTIVLGSTGEAAEYRGAFLGEFVEQEQEHNGRPSYRQRNTESGQEIFLRFNQNAWRVSRFLRKTTPPIKNRNNTDIPPTTGWEYLSNDKKWKSDDNTLALEFSSLSPCQVIQVEADEEVRKYIGQQMGNYSHQEERWSSGKPVYQKTNSEQKWYLLVPDLTTIWVIRSNTTDKRARKLVESGRATNLPTDAEAGSRPSDGVSQWRYWDGNDYKEGNISISCT